MYNILYNILMKTDISTILSSKAKYRVLRTLFLQKIPIPLRHIGYLSNLYIYSVQQAVKNLLITGLIERKLKGRETLYFLNKNHNIYAVIINLFTSEIENEIKERARNYTLRAKSSLVFANSVHKLFSNMRSN